MRLRQRLGLRAGLALLTAALVVLEIALHRIYTALFGHHLGLAVLPLALLGLGGGAVLLHLAPGLVRPPALLARLGYFAAGAAAATLATVLIIIHTKAPDAFDRAHAGKLAALALAAFLPFVPAGAALAATFRHAARDLGRLGFTAFGTAAAAGPIALVALRVGAPRVGLVVMVIDALAALAFYLGARTRAGEPPHPRTRGAIVATALLAAGVLLAGDLGAPWIKVTALRWAPLDKVEAQEWTPLGLVTVDKAVSGAMATRLDGTFSMPLLEAKNTPPAGADELPYVLHKDAAPVAVLGAGAGRDVRVAEKHGQKEIHAVDPNGFLVRGLVRDRYKKFSGELYDKPEVQLAVEDPRGFLRRSTVRFRTIVVPLPDTEKPAALGALAAVPAFQYTVESLREALQRLTPDGVVLVSRWDTDFDRLFALAAVALRKEGVATPAQHLFACSAARATSLLISRAPLGGRELGLLRGHCRRNKLSEAFAPDQPHNELRKRLVTEPDPLAIAAAEATELTPPTDDRPYWFASVPPRHLGELLGDSKTLKASQQAILVLVALGWLATAALLLGVGAPAVRPPRDRERGARLAPLVHFAATAATFVLASAAFGTRLPLLLGHPGHALTTVHVAVLAFAAAGSLLAARIPAASAARASGYRAQILVVAFAAAAVGLGGVVNAALGLSPPACLMIAVLMLAPIGLLLGALPTLGIKLLVARTPELVPWCLGAAAVGGALAAPLGGLLAMMLGNGAVLLAAGATALLAAASVPRARRG